jgi:hypothetical protein
VIWTLIGIMGCQIPPTSSVGCLVEYLSGLIFPESISAYQMVTELAVGVSKRAIYRWANWKKVDRSIAECSHLEVGSQGGCTHVRQGLGFYGVSYYVKSTL